MTQEELQKKYNHLLEKVRRMRGVQKEFFKYRARADLDLSRRLEREVDHLIQDEVNNQKSKQIPLL
ncbi:hypothetical protein [Deminuibacter soli]|uniref:Uncharacterized protein n=1 Tax=Deminuibacter soli TaxID=2291815 RepID=A0A3E1NQ54_9BACT|nr:hypothetical protein [Deminuibacter soli]RFM30053.1 hypothetical protein DXN05_03515 [Deminuibacter soli]